MLSEALAVGDDSASRVRDLLVHVGLSHEYESRKPAALSGGERQRVALARALALRPRLIVCDEPVSALDVSVQAQILNLLKQLREDLGLGYLFITHDLGVVRHVADRMYVLHRGAVVESGAVDKVLDTPSHEYTARLMAAIPRHEPGWLDDLRDHASTLAAPAVAAPHRAYECFGSAFSRRPACHDREPARGMPAAGSVSGPAVSA